MTFPSLLAVFEHEIPVTGFWRLGMLAPLSLSISVVYKTIHCRRLRDIPLASIVLSVTILAVMFAIGLGLLLVFRWLA